MERYLLFHVDMSGYLSDSATYTSDVGEARQVDFETAIQYCRKFKQTDGLGEIKLVLLPIRYEHVRRIVD